MAEVISLERRGASNWECAGRARCRHRERSVEGAERVLVTGEPQSQNDINRPTQARHSFLWTEIDTRGKSHRTILFEVFKGNIQREYPLNLNGTQLCAIFRPLTYLVGRFTEAGALAHTG